MQLISLTNIILFIFELIPGRGLHSHTNLLNVQVFFPSLVNRMQFLSLRNFMMAPPHRSDGNDWICNDKVFLRNKMASVFGGFKFFSGRKVLIR